ncbi:MAG: class I SAM-dependent methyltransferase [Bacteroidota bacterium]
MTDISIFSGERAANYNRFVERWIPGYTQLVGYMPGLIEVSGKDPIESVLIAGCGTGNEMAAINDQKPEWVLTGVDPSPEMVAQARQLLGGRPNVLIEDGRVGDLPVEDKYGAATLLLVMHFLPDDGQKLALLKDIADRLKPGSPLVLVDIYGSLEKFDNQLQMLKGMLLADVAAEEIDERLIMIKERIQYISEDQLSALVREAGFSELERFFQAGIYGGWVIRK